VGVYSGEQMASHCQREYFIYHLLDVKILVRFNWEIDRFKFKTIKGNAKCAAYFYYSKIFIA